MLKIIHNYCRVNKLFTMKIFIIAFCLISTKSALGINDYAPPQRMTYFRRRLFPPFPTNSYRRVNPNVAKLIFLKHLLELDCFNHIFFQDRIDHHQKHPSAMRINATPESRNKSSHYLIRNRITSNGAGTRYFKNPKIIIVPSLMRDVKTIKNDFQNRERFIGKSNLPQYWRTLTKYKEGTRKKGESFRKEDYNDNLASAKESVTKISKLEESKTDGGDVGKVQEIPPQPHPTKPSTVAYPKSTFGQPSFLSSNSTQTYEVEEVFEDTLNIDESNYKKMTMDEGTYFQNKLKDTSSEKQEQETIDNSIMTIITGMTGSKSNVPTTENIINEVSVNSGEKVPAVQTVAPTPLHHSVQILPSVDERKVKPNEIKIPLKTTPIVKEYPNRGIIPNSGWFPNRKLNNGEGTVQPLNQKIFGMTPSTTPAFAVSDDKKKQKVETSKPGTVPHTFLEFFNKALPENLRLKTGVMPKNLNLNAFTSSTTPSNSRGNLSDRNTQKVLKILAKDEPMRNEHPSSTTQSDFQTFTTTTQGENKPMIPFARTTKTQTPLRHGPENHTSAENKTAPLTSLQNTKGEPFTTSSSLATTNFKQLSDGPLSLDLLSTTITPEVKKDQESSGKNSRKMHFNQDSQKETELNQISESSQPEPRRSDILIADYMDDYKDNENRLSSLSYMEKIKGNDTISTDDFLRNIKMDSLVPLVPQILIDIREKKISRQDYLLLSRVFGKYWSTILAMSNHTELDVLPLLTMKSEKDLINILDSHFYNESDTSATETPEVKVDVEESSELTYDYINEYKDLYDYVLNDYVLGQDLGEKRKRYRRKTDDELKYQKVQVYKESLGKSKGMANK